jgi:TolA-binding protein
MTRASAPDLGDPEDLSVRARQGSLSEAERLVWERALAADPTLSVAHQVGVDFDHVGLVQSGDDQLVARMADRTLNGECPRRRVASARRRLVFVLAAALTVAGTATAWHGGVLRRSAPALASDAARAAQPLSGAQAKPVVPATPPLEPPRGAALPPVALPPVASDSGHAPAASPNAVDDAAALFREAAAARRSSDFGRARLLYLRLESAFPGSPEARLAPVSLGKVLLLMGRAGEAEQQFSQYSSAGGTLAEEALVGQAQSLARLGRASDEQRVWQRLLRDFPHSLYAVEATQRLSALGAADPR